MFTFQKHQVSSIANHQEIMHELHHIFAATLNPDITQRQFRFYYMAHQPHLIDISFVVNAAGKIVGFITATFYRKKIAGKNITLCKTAIGMLPGLRGGYLPMEQLFSKFINYKLAHIREDVVIAICLANPIMYAMMCKNTGTMYPKPGINITSQIRKSRLEIAKLLGLERRQQADHIIKIHFRVKQCEANLKRIYSSNNPYVQYYLEQGIAFSEGETLFVTIPVTLINIIRSVSRVFVVRPVTKLVRALKENWQGAPKKWLVK